MEFRLIDCRQKKIAESIMQYIIFRVIRYRSVLNMRPVGVVDIAVSAAIMIAEGLGFKSSKFLSGTGSGLGRPRSAGPISIRASSSGFQLKCPNFYPDSFQEISRISIRIGIRVLRALSGVLLQYSCFCYIPSPYSSDKATALQYTFLLDNQ
jgi:hypothetical protein